MRANGMTARVVIVLRIHRRRVAKSGEELSWYQLPYASAERAKYGGTILVEIPMDD